MENVANMQGKTIKKKKNIKTTIFVYSLIVWPIIHFTVFWLILNIETILLTFQRFGSKGYEFVGFENYKEIWEWIFNPAKIQHEMMNFAIRHSISILLFLMLVMIPISVFFGYITSKKVPMGGFFKVMFFMPNILSDVVMISLFKLIFEPKIGPFQDILEAFGLGHLTPPLGWFAGDTAWTMVLIECLWAGIGYDMIIFFAAFNRIPQEVIESAKLDGAGFFREFISISLPLVSTTLSTRIILSSGAGLTFFMNSLVLRESASQREFGTIMLVIIDQVKGGSRSLPYAATIGIFFSVICLPLIFGFRKLVEKILPPIEY